MQFSESWLRAFCNPELTTQGLADALTMAGLEVEDLQPVATAFSGVVVAEILEAEQHPNADRLRVCKVNAGALSANGPLQIVCGAPNARAGIKVPLATVGARLPGSEPGSTFDIKVGKLRGVESFGMLCSAKELGIDSDASGLLELSPQAVVGQDIRECLNLDDTLFTLKLTPNLAHALSVYGIAREVSAITGAPLKQPVFTPMPVQRAGDVVPVTIQAPDLCGRFSGRVIRGINPQAQTPTWMVERLARCGQRSINALVDISNYVMFELGRPSHIFDLDHVQGGLEIRWARTGETLKLLNGNTVELNESFGVIADSQGVESLAGIMGGDSTATSDSTRNVYVEAAFWWPQAIAGRSRTLNFSTDAGYRFERGVDAASTVDHLEYLSRLIVEICGGEVGPVTDDVTSLPMRAPVKLRVARASQVIGMPISEAQCVRVFDRLGLPWQRVADGVLEVTPPSWRFDLVIEEDLIEEVIRIVGYDNLPDTPPIAPVVARVLPEARKSLFAVRRQLAASGYQETINFSFIEERWESELHGNNDPIRLLNPIAAPLAVMRSSLIGGLIQILKTNLARRAERVRLFEVGRVFKKDASVAATDLHVEGIHQPMKVAGLAWGSVDMLQWGMADRAVDFFDVKGDVESWLSGVPEVRWMKTEHPALHPGRSASVWSGETFLGVVGELHPRWRQSYDLPSSPVVFELSADALRAVQVPHAQALPKQLGVKRDLALIVNDAMTHAKLQSVVMSASTQQLVKDVRLFDIYQPKQPVAGLSDGERSVALRLELRDDESTLTDEQIDAAMQTVLAALNQAGARLRV